MNIRILQSIRDRLGNKVAELESNRKYMKDRIRDSYQLADPQRGQAGQMAFEDLNFYRDEFRLIEAERLHLGRGIKEIKDLMRASVR